VVRSDSNTSQSVPGSLTLTEMPNRPSVLRVTASSLSEGPSSLITGDIGLMPGSNMAVELRSNTPIPGGTRDDDVDDGGTTSNELSTPGAPIGDRMPAVLTERSTSGLDPIDFESSDSGGDLDDMWIRRDGKRSGSPVGRADKTRRGTVTGGILGVGAIGLNGGRACCSGYRRWGNNAAGGAVSGKLVAFLEWRDPIFTVES